jgi:flagellar secretion chaperone FliS
MFTNSIASYQQIGKDAEILGADPHHLIVLLFDGVEAALVTALNCIASQDIPGRSEALIKATDIISNGLAASLNLQEGGELAQNLNALYDYMVSRLLYANIHQDPRAISEVQKLLAEISGAWREMGESRASTA